MKQLFILKNMLGKSAKNPDGSLMSFENKQDAKKMRQELNEALGDSSWWHVSRGADNKPSYNH